MTAASPEKRRETLPRGKQKPKTDQNELVFGADASESIGKETASDRFQRIWTSCWIDYPLASEGLDQLEQLYARPRNERPKGALIVGEPNMGKTSLVREFQRSKNPTIDPTEELTRVPVVYVQSPPTADPAGLYAAILRTLNAPFKPTARILELQHQVLVLLEKLGTTVLIIDEMHNMLEGQVNQRGVYMNVLKHLSNELRMSIVGVGTTAAVRAVQTDQQLGSRMEPFRLGKWKCGPEYCNFLIQISIHAGVRDFGDIKKKAFIDKMHRMSDGLTGETWELMCRVIEHAFEKNNGKIDGKSVDKINWIPPGARRAAAE